MSKAKYLQNSWLLAEDGSPFVYALNEEGYNRFWINVSSPNCGQSNDTNVSSIEELLSIANLIAAAPELLEALENIVNSVATADWEDSTSGRQVLYNDAIKAIAKAKGLDNV